MAAIKESAKKRLAGLALAAGAIAAVAGCGNPFSRAAGTNTKDQTKHQKASTDAQVRAETACADQAVWTVSGRASVNALYADTGALAADANAGNAPGVKKAGNKLTSDAIAAATLPLPPVDPGSWKTLTVAYAAAGTALAASNASGAVPEIEAGNGAIASFVEAVAKCATAKH